MGDSNQTWFWDQSVRKSFFVKLQEMLTFCTKFPSIGYWKAHYTKNDPFNVGWLSGPAANSKYAWCCLGTDGETSDRKALHSHHVDKPTMTALPECMHYKNMLITSAVSGFKMYIYAQQVPLLPSHTTGSSGSWIFVPYFYLIEGSVQVKNENSFVIIPVPAFQMKFFFVGVVWFL